MSKDNINNIKKELINLKLYLKIIDSKINSLNNDEELIKKEYKELLDKIYKLKKEILELVKANYDKKIEELESEKEKVFNQLLDKISSFNKNKNKLLFTDEQLKIIEEDKEKLKKKYDSYVIDIHELKVDYLVKIEDFDIVIDEYLNDDERTNKFDFNENNKFTTFVRKRYFYNELLQDFMDLFTSRELLLSKWDELDINLENNIIKKEKTNNRINELELKTYELSENKTNSNFKIKLKKQIKIID